MTPSVEDRVKVDDSAKSSKSPPKTGTPSKESNSEARKRLPTIQAILHLPEDAVWGLKKRDLRAYFFALRQHALSPSPESPPLTATCPPRVEPTIDAALPLFLQMPVEIRQLVYTYMLPPPTDPPVRGPHPRQLQTNIHLSQRVPTVLLQLNRQLRAEALPILYGGATQTIFVTIDYNMWKHKSERGDLVLRSDLTGAIKHVDLRIFLGSERRNSKPGEFEAQARLYEVKKGLKKMGKWLAGADLYMLRVGWKEPVNTYLWEQKKDVLDELKALKAKRVEWGEVNWGLEEWNKGRRYRLEPEYLRELERKSEV